MRGIRRTVLAQEVIGGAVLAWRDAELTRAVQLGRRVVHDAALGVGDDDALDELAQDRLALLRRPPVAILAVAQLLFHGLAVGDVHDRADVATEDLDSSIQGAAASSAHR